MQRGQVTFAQQAHSLNASKVAAGEDEIANSVEAVVVEGGELAGDAQEDLLEGGPVPAVDEVEEGRKLL